MERRGDVIIVGGGVIGLTTAYFLARDGVRVVVCDQGQVGMESSWAGAGILPPSCPHGAKTPIERLRARSVALFPELSSELQDRTGISNEFTPSGALEFLSEDSSIHPDEWFGPGTETTILSGEEAATLEPALAPGLGEARHIPGMAQVRNPRHLQALRAACLDTNKVAFHENTPVRGFEIHAGRVQGVRFANEILTGERVILAGGAWTDRLLASIGIRLKIRPVRGQIALVNSARPLFRRVLISGSQYLVPRLDGRVLIGSTEEDVGFEKKTTAEAIRALLDLGMKLVPALASADVERTWAGLRPGNPDGLPFIGPVPGVQGLFVGAGHFRAGIQLSPGTALVLKEMVLGQPLSAPMEAFRLDR